MRPVLSFIFLIFLFIGRTQTITVCDSCEINDLAEAVELKPDTILVKEGVHKAVNIELNTPLVLLGEPGAILDGDNVGYVLKLFADSITISGIKIIRSGRSYTKDFAAIYTFKISDFTIENVEIEDPFFGMLIEKSKNGSIRNNLVFGEARKEDDAGNGIHLWHCSNMQVESNVVYGLRDGIYLEFVDESSVIDNHAYDNIRYGLHFMFSNHDKYLNNVFERNGAGVAVMFSKFIEMRNNQFLNNWGAASYGLLLKEIYDAEVVDNEFIENTTAVFIDGTNRINYKRNLFKQNGWAIKVSGGCYTNQITENNFISNSFDVSYNSKMNDNTFDGNYWSEYSGYDLDRDGVGDVPYRPVKLFSYVVNRTPETIILMRSLFVDIINFSERVSPVFTPDNLIDAAPSISPFR